MEPSRREESNGEATASSDRDFDSPVTWLENFVRRLHQQVGFAVRGNLDHGSVDAGSNENGADRSGTPEPQLDVAGRGSRRIGVTHDGDIREGPAFGGG